MLSIQCYTIVLYTVSFIAVVYVFCCNGVGPNALTLSDFIQMIWDQKPPVVIMLTHLFEKGKVAKYPILSDTTMSIVIYAGIKIVEVHERDCIIDKLVGTDKFMSC